MSLRVFGPQSWSRVQHGGLHICSGISGRSVAHSLRSSGREPQVFECLHGPRPGSQHRMFFRRCRCKGKDVLRLRLFRMCRRSQQVEKNLFSSFSYSEISAPTCSLHEHVSSLIAGSEYQSFPETFLSCAAAANISATAFSFTPANIFGLKVGGWFVFGRGMVRVAYKRNKLVYFSKLGDHW
jgi:hypothetical protein